MMIGYLLTKTQSQIMMIWLSSDDTLSHCALTSAKMRLLIGPTMLFFNRSKDNEEVIECRHCF
jgi:hypothetical protein